MMLYQLNVKIRVTYNTMETPRDNFQSIGTWGLCRYENPFLWREFIRPLHNLDTSERPLTTHTIIQYRDQFRRAFWQSASI